MDVIAQHAVRAQTAKTRSIRIMIAKKGYFELRTDVNKKALASPER
jgi:hypothetical protein